MSVSELSRPYEERVTDEFLAELDQMAVPFDGNQTGEPANLLGQEGFVGVSDEDRSAHGGDDGPVDPPRARGGDDGPWDSIDINMPSLMMSGDGRYSKPTIPMPRSGRRLVVARANMIASPLIGRDLKDTERAALEASARGLTAAKYADEIHVGPVTVWRRTARASEILATPNTASAVYRALLHGIIDPPEDDGTWPKLTTNQTLYLYTGAVGFKAQEDRRLFDRADASATSRTKAFNKIGAFSISHAIGLAFVRGHYRPMSKPNAT
jgi:hypothetical protein